MDEPLTEPLTPSPSPPPIPGTGLPEVTVRAGERPQGLTVLAYMNFFFGIGGILLLVSGFGYWKQRKFLGRFMGNIYAIFGLCGFGVGLYLWNFGLLNATELVFPLITLFLINVVFREDFVH